MLTCFLNKKLAVFTDCIHYYDEMGNIGSDIYVLVKQLEALAIHFQSVIIYCPFGRRTSGPVFGTYKAENISFYPLPLVGGNKFINKVRIVMTLPKWFKAYLHARKNADYVYQRFPNNLNIPGSIFFWFVRAKVFASYTGTWINYSNEPVTYRFQKWFLKHFFRGPFGVYIGKDNDNGRIFKSFSPSYSSADWASEINNITLKAERFSKGSLTDPVFISVGSLVASKNHAFLIDIFERLHIEGVAFTLYIVGDGPLYNQLSETIRKRNLTGKIVMTGMIQHNKMSELYRKSDFAIQASVVEGYGKVPIEGFFYGVIPILNNINMAPEITAYGRRGFLFSIAEPMQLLSLISNIINDSGKLLAMMHSGRDYVQHLTLEAWAKLYLTKIQTYFEEE